MSRSTGPAVDEPKSVREGEGLDVALLDAYLKSQVPGLAAPLVIEQFPKGHSNLTYLVRAGDAEWVLRRPPFGHKIKTAHDMSREFRILSHLTGVYAKIPRPLLYCEDEAILGAPFYMMERVRGVILRGTHPSQGAALSKDVMRKLCEALVDNLVALHAVDVEASGLAELGHPQGYVERQIKGWTDRYQKAKTDEITEVEEAAQWLLSHMPPESGVALIHNDYKYDNLVLDPDDLTQIKAVLDWEMATLGDPLMDLGTTLGYWIDPTDPEETRMLPFGPTLLEGNLCRREVVERYAEATGKDVSGILFHYVYGLFKVAVIAQQIYKRFKDGFSKDPRFAMMIVGVQVLGKTASLAIDKDRIYELA